MAKIDNVLDKMLDEAKRHEEAAMTNENKSAEDIGFVEQVDAALNEQRSAVSQMIGLISAVNAAGSFQKSAYDLLLEAANTLQTRGKERDKPSGERSMLKAVQIFNAIHPESALTEIQGWRFMQCLKLAREVQGGFKEDDYLDGIGYAALKAECAILEKG